MKAMRIVRFISLVFRFWLEGVNLVQPGAVQQFEESETDAGAGTACRLIVPVYQQEVLLAEGELQSVGEFHFDFAAVLGYFPDAETGMVLVDILLDRCGHDIHRHASGLVLDFFPFPVAVKGDLDAVGQDYFVFFLQPFHILAGQGGLAVAVMGLQEDLGWLRQLVAQDGFFVIGPEWAECQCDDNDAGGDAQPKQPFLPLGHGVLL